jgi:hypothetical protein
MNNVSYDENHWFNQELAKLAQRLITERPRKVINGVECISASYDPEMTAMVVQSLSSMLGKLAAILCGANVDPALISKILEGASHNAFDEATAMANKFKEVGRDEIR